MSDKDLLDKLEPTIKSPDATEEKVMGSTEHPAKESLEGSEDDGGSTKEQLAITLKLTDDNEACLYFRKGPEVARDADEADAILDCAKDEDCEAIDEFISKIPEFSDLKPGGEASIITSVEDLKEKYDIDLELIEEEVHKDLDGDDEAGESEEHKEEVEGDETHTDIMDAMKHEHDSYDPLEVMSMTNDSMGQGYGGLDAGSGYSLY